jgi:hypothetical protein
MNTTKRSPSIAHGRTLAPRLASGLAAVCALLTVSAADAQVRAKGLTGGLETSNRFVTLPAAPRGSLFVRECGECPSVRLEFGSDTRYFIGDQPVSYAQLREVAAKGDAGLVVSYRLGTRTLTRLRLTAAGY